MCRPRQQADPLCLPFCLSERMLFFLQGTLLLLLAATFGCSNSLRIIPQGGWGSHIIRKIGTSAIAGAFLANPQFVPPASAFGPTEVKVQVLSYKVVDLCNGAKPIMPGQKAMEGLYPVCIQVEANVINPDKAKTLKDVSVYGFVKEDGAGNSVLPNNPDFKSDAGQYAMIKSVPPGESKVIYEFVAAVQQNVPKGEPMPSISFMKTKAVSYPGGEKFQPLSDCEMDPRLCGLDDDE